MIHLGDVAFDEFPVLLALVPTFLAVAAETRPMDEQNRDCGLYPDRCRIGFVESAGVENQPHSPQRRDHGGVGQ